MQSQLGKTLLTTSRQLARRHSSRLGAEAAQDLASEAMLRALQTPPPDGRFAPWMERIFHNLMVDSMIEIPNNFIPAFQKMIEDVL